MAEIDFKCFSKVVKSRFFAQHSYLSMRRSPFFVTFTSSNFYQPDFWNPSPTWKSNPFSRKCKKITRSVVLNEYLSSFLGETNMSFFRGNAYFGCLQFRRNCSKMRCTGWLIKTWDPKQIFLNNLDRISLRCWRIYCILLFSLLLKSLLRFFWASRH